MLLIKHLGLFNVVLILNLHDGMLDIYPGTLLHYCGRVEIRLFTGLGLVSEQCSCVTVRGIRAATVKSSLGKTEVSAVKPQHGSVGQDACLITVMMNNDDMSKNLLGLR